MTCVEVAMGEVCWLTLNRPKVGNAIDQEMILALDYGLDQALEPTRGVRCIVVTGAGDNFCSGIDLRSMKTPLPDESRYQKLMSRSYFDHVIERLVNLRIPVITAVNGVAAGAGMTLALTGDVIVMEESAHLTPSFVKLGLVPDCGITSLLSDRIGNSRARAALMLGEPIDAKSAVAWGLAHDMVPPGNLRSRSAQYASRLIAGPPCVLGETRQLLNRLYSAEFGKYLEAERAAHRAALKECEHTEGIAAFLEHRTPNFKSR